MSRYQTCFNTLKEKKEGAFIPFVMLGDPSPEMSLAIIDTLIQNGADALELGIPFSDPLADGIIIQNAGMRALNNQVTLTTCFELIANIREKHPDIPIGLLIYANLIIKRGIDKFYYDCSQSGVDSVLIADVPFEESLPFYTTATTHNIDTIFICPPNADQSLIENIAKYGRGYTYLVSRSGVTGIDKAANIPLNSILHDLNHYQAPPALLGFGISTPEHVFSAIAHGVTGVISGSAIVKIIEDNLNDIPTMQQKLAQFVTLMKQATYNLS